MLAVRAVTGLRVAIPAVCEIHGGAGHVVVRRESGRVVLDGHADDCCVLWLDDAAARLLFDRLASWGDRSAHELL